MSRNLHSFLGFSLAVLLGGCGPREESAPAGPAPARWALERESTGGPVTLVLRLDRVELPLGGRVVLEEELRVEPGYESDFPEYLSEDFEGFSVVEIDTDPPPPAPPASAVPQVSRRSKRLTLEPDRSGTLAVAPLAVYFRRSGEDKESSFLTEELQLTVTPLGDPASLALVGELAEAWDVPPAEGRAILWPWVTGTSGLVLLAIVLAWWFRRTRKPPPPTPPEELAYEALRRLVAAGLVEKGEVETFFVLLSAILREYIENRFQVRAPERTTEEFLEEASRHGALLVHRATLAEFLVLSDRVKFARYEPDERSIQGAFDVTRQFIEETCVADPAHPRELDPCSSA